MRSLNTARCGILAVCMLVIAGCSGKPRPKTVAVSGTVKYKGVAVEGATVTFMAKGSARPAYGKTNSEGKFELSTFGTNDGAVPGKHVVTVSKLEGGAAVAGGDPTKNMNDTEAMAKMMQKTAKAPKSLLPLKYASANTTPFKGNDRKVVTADGENHFDLELTD